MIPTLPAKRPNSNNPGVLAAWRRRRQKYIRERGTDATIQLDGFLATDRNAFEALVVGSVDRFFSKKIYNEAQRQLEQDRKTIPRLLRKNLQNLTMNYHGQTQNGKTNNTSFWLQDALTKHHIVGQIERILLNHSKHHSVNKKDWYQGQIFRLSDTNS